MRRTATIWLLLGLGLLLLNLAGLARGLRSPHLDPGMAERPTPLAPWRDAIASAGRLPGEADSSYLVRLSAHLHTSMLHFYPDLDRSPALHFRVPLWENYLLHAFAWLRPTTYRQYEFRVAERAIERGYGACSQFALAAIDLLNRNGIRASLVSLSNHVVVRAHDAQGREWVVDPDYGVAAPIALADIARQPILARRLYDGIAWAGDPAIPDSLPAAMQASFQARPPRDLGGPAEPLSRMGAVYWMERATYALKWLIPAALLGLAVARRRRERNLKSDPAAR
jgi:hypothetical protein